MCIKVDRWFYCHVQGQGPPVPPERELTNTHEGFWTHWQHGETVGLNEQYHMDLPTLKGYHYVRHKDERWIRCAMTDVTACLQYPLEIRTELYDIPCPDCSQDDPCVLSAQPVRTFKNPSPNMTPEAFAHIADAYAYEIITLITSFFRMQLNRLELDEPSWNVHQRGLYCTLDRDHIVRDTPIRLEGPVEYPCYLDCFCTARPWAQNTSRAARNQDATQVRIRGVDKWFLYAQNDENPPLWASRHFASMPNQLWLNMHGDGLQRYGRLVSQITTAVSQLDRLGPTIQAGSGRRGRFMPSAYRGIVRLGQFTAMKLIAYPCLDPGVTTDFLDLLMRNHFLTALCPFLDTTRDEKGWRYTLNCHQPASPEMETLLVQSGHAFRDPRRRAQASQTGMRHTRLVNALERNRAICHSNSLIKTRVAEGFAHSWVANSSYAASNTKTCHICAEDFDNVNADSEIPPHLRAIQTRCCHQFMHVRCLKGTALRREKCPLCNTNFEDMGFSTQRFAPHEQLGEETHRGHLPEGMMERPNTHERRRMGDIIGVMMDLLEAPADANDGPWT
ncbi:hypothetical protein NW755_000417 [Fusarium falciforme]|uniref:RING-type domain-containing protein n=1 Tax=Fusarium falciforme TaxID=195108 RepID=A0A9W8V5J8_9HYPO|nr:hypothetical protein NW755_000417 [Fusarium falciforme]